MYSKEDVKEEMPQTTEENLGTGLQKNPGK